MDKLKHLDLFSGVGGFSYAASLFGDRIKTVQFVEIDKYAQIVLKQNFPGIPIHDDITTFHYRDSIDLITAGFPCQDISNAAAAKRLGLDGKRSGLFFEVVRLIRECRPRYVLLENVAALLTSNKRKDFGAVLWALAEIGYDAEWEVIPASAIGACHVRERIWIIAYPNSNGCEQGNER